MGAKQTALGPLGAKFFSLMQTRNQNLVKLGELQTVLKLTPGQEQTLLKRLADNGFLLRLQKGVYLVPKKLPAGGSWRPNDYYVIDQFMKLSNAKYYIGGFSAVYYHGLVQQVVDQFTIYNDKYTGIKNFGQLRVSFIKVSKKRIAGYTRVSVPNSGTVNMATLAKTLVDLIQDWSRYMLLEEAYTWMTQACKETEFLQELILLVSKVANKVTIRRIAYWLWRNGVSQKKLMPLIQQLSPVKDYIVLYPNKQKIGNKNKKWWVLDNGEQT